MIKRYRRLIIEVEINNKIPSCTITIRLIADQASVSAEFLKFALTLLTKFV